MSIKNGQRTGLYLERSTKPQEYKLTVLPNVPLFRQHTRPSSWNKRYETHSASREGGGITSSWQTLFIHGSTCHIQGQAAVLTQCTGWLDGSVAFDQLTRTARTRMTISSSPCRTPRTGPCTWATSWGWRSSSWW
jgi:hypothetical protein